MPSPPETRVNVADRLAAVAAERPDAIALAAYDGQLRRNGSRVKGARTAGWDPAKHLFSSIDFGHLNSDANTLARGFAAMGIGPGKRIALLVKPGVEFVTLVFALLRSGATMVLVDAGLGRKNLVRCLAATEPDGFVAIPLGHAMRVVKRKHFPKAKLNVTVGRRWFWGGETLASLRRLGRPVPPSPVSGGGIEGGGEVGTRVLPPPLTPPPETGEGNDFLPYTTADDPAAIAFTSGSTGPPKGVLYTHETFVTQCDSIQREYDIRPGDIDLACFPLFGLFNVACGVTTILPEMDFSRPASCDPKKLLAAANQWKVNQAFASPAVWDRLSRHCETTGESIPTLRKVLSCGAPVPAKVMRRTLACVHPEATMHTPYGATESLPVATIEAKEVLGETAAKTDEGAGVCVGRKFGSRQQAERSRQDDGEPSAPAVGDPLAGFDWRVIRITDDPIATIDESEELPTGEIGELIVRGPQVSKRYLTNPGSDHNAQSKIKDGGTIWHRIGDVGYFDDQERFWYCGRKSQRVVTASETVYTECFEALFNRVRGVQRSALVGVADAESHRAVLVVERDGTEEWEDVESDLFTWDSAWTDLADSRGITFLEHQELPTDIRHNSKIHREELAVWAEKQLRENRS